MTLHPLTKELLSVRFNDVSIEKILNHLVKGYLTSRAEWLKNELCAEGYNDAINQAFQLAPKTLEEKLHAIRRKHDGDYPSPEDFWDAVLKDFVKTAEEHFHNLPLARTVNCSVQQEINP